MLLDKEMELAAEMSLTATARTPNQLKLGPKSFAGNASGNLGLELHFNMVESAVGSGTVTFQVCSAPFSDMSSAKVHFQSRPLTAAELQVGTAVPFRGMIPFDADSYLDVNVAVAGTISAGKVNITGGASRRTNY